MSVRRPGDSSFELADLSMLWLDPVVRRRATRTAQILGALLVLWVGWLVFSPAPPDTRPAALAEMVTGIRTIGAQGYGQGSLMPRLFRLGVIHAPQSDPAAAPVHPWGGALQVAGQGASARLMLGGLSTADCATAAQLCKSDRLAGCRSVDINGATRLGPADPGPLPADDARAACAETANRIDLVVQ